MGAFIWIDQCSSFFRNKKHFCPCCQTLLTRHDASKTIHTSSPEADKPENAKFMRRARGARGSIEFIWTEFECQDCRHYWTADELYDIEAESAHPKTKVLRRMGARVLFFLLAILWFVLLSLRS